jgi:hypothetical protein
MKVDFAMLAILVGLGLMFVVLCVVLQMFSRLYDQCHVCIVQYVSFGQVTSTIQN